jgi:hypothetical protein
MAVLSLAPLLVKVHDANAMLSINRTVLETFSKSFSTLVGTSPFWTSFAYMGSLRHVDKHGLRGLLVADLNGLQI